jgi:hypothetical protein
MSTLTVAQFREHFETDLPDTAIQRVIDSVEAEIAEIAGPTGAQSYTKEGGDTNLFFMSPISSITQIQERANESDDFVILDSTDYLVMNGGFYLTRIHTGAHPRYKWGCVVLVDASHDVSAESKRVLATIDIVKMELQYNGVMQENAGGYNEMMSNWLTERKAILRGLSRGLMLQ